MNSFAVRYPSGGSPIQTNRAEAVLWLLSNQSRYVTGSHLICDGGVIAKASISV